MSRLQLKTLALYTGLFLILALNALFLKGNAFRHLDFYNMGSFLDGGWRILQGQKPFVDFMLNVGPVHIYLNAFFYYFFGFTKAGVLAHLIAISSFVILLTFFVARKKLSSLYALLLAALSATTFYWACSHPWYNHTAHLLGMIGVATLVIHLPFSGTKPAFWTGVICGAVAWLSFLTKTNVGPLYGLLFLVVLAVSGQKRAAILGWAAGLLFSAVISIPLFLHDPFEAFRSILAYSQTQSWRLTSFSGGVSAWFRDYYWLVAAIVIVNVIAAKKLNLSQLILFVGLWPLTLFVAYSSLSNNNADAPLMNFYFILALILIGKSKNLLNRASRAALMAMIVLLTGLYAKNGFALESWVPAPSDYSIQTPQFRGWRCLKQHGEPMDGLVQFIQTSVPKEDSLLIVTDMQFLYGLSGHEPLKHVPYGYAIGFVPTPGEQREQCRTNIMNNPPKWLITHEQSGGYAWNSWLRYLDLSQWVLQYYVVEKTFGNYAVLKLR